MKEIFRVFIGTRVIHSEDETAKRQKMVDNILRDLNIKNSRIDQDGDHALTLRKGDPRLKVLATKLKQLNISIITREERVYTKKEIESAELLVLYITAYCGSGYNVYGTEFDKSNVCPVCGAGEVQKSDLIIDKKEMGKKNIAITYNYEVVISERLADILDQSNLTGYVLRPVHHYRKMKNEPELYQLIPTCVLPPIASPPAELVRGEHYCDACGRNGLGITSPFFYRLEDVRKTEKCDFYYTTEYFGVKLQRKIPSQALIISQRAYRVLKENKIRNIKVEPVQIIDGGDK